MSEPRNRTRGAWLAALLDFAYAPEERVRRRLARLPTVPIAAAKEGASVKLEGRIVALSNELIAAPFSARMVVWRRATYSTFRRDDYQPRDGYGTFWGGTGLLRQRNGTWHRGFVDIAGAPFLLEDGSGENALLDLTRVQVHVRNRPVADSPYLNADPPELKAFMHAHQQTTSPFMGSDLEKLFEEAVLVPGDRIVAAGVAARVPGPPVQDGYRDSTSTWLTLTGKAVVVKLG